MSVYRNRAPVLAALAAIVVALGACGSDGGSGDTGGQGGLPSAEAAKGWADKFCDAEIGMTREAMRKLMGEPTEEYTPENTPSGFDPQMIWQAYQFHFTAFFDADDRVRQLDVNDLDLSEAEKNSIGCLETRAA